LPLAGRLALALIDASHWPLIASHFLRFDDLHAAARLSPRFVNDDFFAFNYSNSKHVVYKIRF